MKKLCCTLMILALLCCGALAEGNLLKNGDFSAVTNGLPDYWHADMWHTDIGVSILSVVPDGYDGPAVMVENVDANDARFAQTVAVEPNSVYRLSGMIRAENCDPEGFGANLSVSGLFTYSDAIYDTAGEWQRAELVGRTGPNQTDLTVFARVGGYSTLSEGTAWFDNLSLEKLDDVPEGVIACDFYDAGRAKSNNVSNNTDDPTRYTETWLLFICLYALAAVALTRKRGRSLAPADDSGAALLVVGLSLAFAVRLVLSVRMRGYYTDINCFTAWSERIFTTRLSDYYAPDYFCDYPPGYMLMLWPVAAIRRLLGITTNSAAYWMLLKALPMLADMAGAALIWRAARKRFSGRAAATLALLYAFNPAAITNSAAWGQIDGVFTLTIVLCAVAAVEYHYVAALAWFAVALLIKPQALLFAPLGLLCILLGILRAQGARRRLYLKRALIGTAAFLGILYGTAFLFCAGQGGGPLEVLGRPVVWLVELYAGTMKGYKYLTVNALNLFCLLGMNWQRVDDHMLLTAFAWVLFGLSYVYSGTMLALGARRPRRLLLTGGLLIVLICTFGPMIHERYVFPGMLLLLLAFAAERDVRLLISLIVLTCTLFMNEALVLQGGITAANYGHLHDSERWLNNLLCGVNILNALFLAWTTLDICAFDGIWPLQGRSAEEVPEGLVSLHEPARWRLNLRRADALLMCAVTLVYGVVAFVNLGDLSAPQTSWISSVSGETVTFDLGREQTFRMTYYGGVCNSTFTVELSNDGEIWTEPCVAQYNQGEIFRWIWYVPMDSELKVLYNETVPTQDGTAWVTYATGGEAYPFQTARYVRLTARSAGLTLFEVGFLDAEGHALPIESVNQSGQTASSESSAARLVDEQSTVASCPSYLNSTCFDEIYHARTAYEQIHAMSAYEWTHPPLGKALMMVGIELFGMTPFGWRFMGTLVGVLMVPLIYLLAMQLTHDTKLSFIAMCLLALDSMHFTQTRIATIDSYAVFWIMLMYLFMFRYCQMSWNRESFRRTLVPLGLCGVTMGIAWATKWIGIYASAGLAFLFFWTLWRRIREARTAPEGIPGTARRVILTLLFCMVFFVAIPLTIYYFSYTFQLRGEGVRHFADMLSRDRLDRVIQLQKSIFGYHAGLAGDTHYFRSPWYQWPVIWWPMWYYSGTPYLPEGVISSISCMGNPAVWWFGLVALLYMLVHMAWTRRASKSSLMVAVGFASQFLPWVIVPRSTFIYHYFASVPFIILASALLLGRIRERSERGFRIVTGVLLGSALALFVAFYPLESGLPMSRSYAKYLRWFKWYNY